MSLSNLYNLGNKQNPYSDVHCDSVDTKVSNVDEQFTPPMYPLIPLVAPAGAVHTNGNDSMYLSDGTQWNLIGSSSGFPLSYFTAEKTSIQSIPDATPTDIVSYTSKSGPLSGDFNLTTGIWTVGESGIYSVTIRSRYPPDPMSSASTDLYLNGGSDSATVSSFINNIVQFYSISSSNQILTNGDVINLRTMQTNLVPATAENLDFAYISVIKLGSN